jgi:hypothetical protein
MLVVDTGRGGSMYRDHMKFVCTCDENDAFMYSYRFYFSQCIRLPR